MSDTQKHTDGGPAFPTVTDHPMYGLVCEGHGMSLRDYFAGQVAVALAYRQPIGESQFRRMLAREAYGLADAMIAVREARP